MGLGGGVLTCQQAEDAATPLVGVHRVRVDVAHQDPIVVEVQVVPAQHVEMAPHSGHNVVYPPLEHGAVSQPVVLTQGEGGQQGKSSQMKWALP